MTTDGQGYADVRISVRRPSACGIDDDLLRDAIIGCASAEASDLAIPLAGGITVSIDDGPWRLTVNGADVPVPHPRYATRLRQSSEHWAAEAIHGRPDLLITPAAASALWRGAADVPPAFADLLARLARHWARPARGAEIVADASEWDGGAAFEAALCEADDAVRVFVDPATHAAVQLGWEAGWRAELNGSADVFRELGVLVGDPVLALDETLPAHHFAVAINDVRTCPAPCVAPGQMLVGEAPESLKLHAVAGEPAVQPGSGFPATLAAAEHAETLASSGIVIWDPAQYLRLVVTELVRRHASKLYNRNFVEYLVELLRPSYPVLEAQIAAIGGLGQLTRVLRRLVAERVSVRDFVGIVGSVHAAPSAPRTPPGMMSFSPGPFRPSLAAVDEHARAELELVEAARIAQSRAITFTAARTTSTLTAYLLDPQIARRLADPRPLVGEERQALVDAVTVEIDALPRSASVPVLLTPMDVRWRVAHTLRPFFPTLTVLAHEQLAPDVNVQPVARISVDGALG